MLWKFPRIFKDLDSYLACHFGLILSICFTQQNYNICFEIKRHFGVSLQSLDITILLTFFFRWPDLPVKLLRFILALLLSLSSYPSNQACLLFIFILIISWWHAYSLASVTFIVNQIDKAERAEVLLASSSNRCERGPMILAQPALAWFGRRKILSWIER